MKKNHIIFASFFGNALEFYDFTLYGAFAITIGETFFPSSSPTAALLKSLITFAVGFLMRPFGAAVFGYIGDRFGRKRALTLSILLMGLPTFIIGVLPSYESIGWLAPASILLCRLLQGLCAGGEYNGAAIFALEHVGKKSPGFVGGMITASAGLGALFAMGVAILVKMPFMPENAWRYAFIGGAVVSLWGWHVRRCMEESPVFQELQTHHKVEKSPLKEALTNQKYSAVMTMIFGAFDGVLSYIVFVFLDIYLERYAGLPETFSKIVTFLSIFCFTIGSPFMGHFLDYFPKKRFLQVTTIAVAILGFPAFWCLANDYVLLAGVLLGFMASSIAGAQHAFVQHLFPPKDRYSGIAFSFSIGIAIGGFTPFLLAEGMTLWGSPYVASLYILFWSFVCFIALSRVKRYY